MEAVHDYSPAAIADLVSGLVDDRLRSMLRVLGSEFRLTIPVIKTGHPMGPTSPAGRENSHYYYRAADIVEVNGVPVLGNEHSDQLVRLGQALRDLPVAFRPQRIYGPTAWHQRLGFGHDDGFFSSPFHDAIHADHLHLGYLSVKPTPSR